MINVLVTAVGGELAFAVIKAVKLFHKPYTLTGCDIYPEVVGKYWCHNFYNVPFAKEENEYIKAIIGIVKKNKITCIIPTADIELLTLSKYKKEFKEKYNCHVLTNDYEEIVRFSDKWLAYKWFVDHRIITAATFLADDIEKLKDNIAGFNYPLFLKPRVGGGSRSVFKINSFDEIVKYLPVVHNPIVQEYLLPDDEEYTAGTYRNAEDEIFVITMKRTLKFGMTNKAEIVLDTALEKFVKNVITNTNLKGSNNVQFRVTNDGPKILEINPRFSGTTGIRATFGFNDPEMWIRESLFNEKVNAPEIKSGFVMRFMEDQYHFKKQLT